MRSAAVLILTSALVSGCAGAPPPLTTPTGAPTVQPPPSVTPEPSATARPTATATAPVALRLVAIGDSIPHNAQDDCPGCTGFVDRYAEAVAAATGRPVEASNLSEHTGLTLSQLLEKLDVLEPRLAEADVIVVAIAHNSWELNADEPCGAPLREGDTPDWDAIDDDCAVKAAERYRAEFAELYGRIAALRDGQPTLLRTINRYNDWIGWAEGNLTSEDERKAKLVADRWNAMLCEAAEQNGFGCADVYRAFNGPDGLTPAGELLAADHNHPSDRGNDAIAEELAKLGFAPFAGPATGTGSWILYQAVFAGVEEVDLGLARPDGTDAQRIAGGPGNRWHPDWSPDGKKVAYDYNFPDDSSALGLINLDGGSDLVLTECVAPCMNHQAPAWSPDGRMIGFDGWEDPVDGPEVCFLALLEVSTGDITRIIEWPACDQNESADDRPLSEGIRMRFSPNGERIVFQGEGPRNQSAIFISTVAGQDVQQLTPWGLGARPDWSPDGESIVFHTEEPEHQDRHEVSLHRVRPDGSDLQRLTQPGGTTTDVYARYLPDGSGILFSRCLSLLVCETRMIDPDGSNDLLLFGELGRQTVHVMLQPTGD